MEPTSVLVVQKARNGKEHRWVISKLLHCSLFLLLLMSWWVLKWNPRNRQPNFVRSLFGRCKICRSHQIFCKLATTTNIHSHALTYVPFRLGQARVKQAFCSCTVGSVYANLSWTDLGTYVTVEGIYLPRNLRAVGRLLDVVFGASVLGYLARTNA